MSRKCVPAMKAIARVPPVGERILTKSGGDLPFFAGYKAQWLESGTAALALAMQAARHARPKVERPQVVLPAYGCPDLVAAAVFARLEPVLADIQPLDPGYSMEALKAAITSQTVAVVAVNFLGIAERLSCVRELLEFSEGAALIEDNAQWYPSAGSALEGDYVCLSFGRGKPVSVLAGGALLSRWDRWNEEGAAALSVSPPSAARGSWELSLHNLLLRPAVYGIASRLPGTRIGETRLEQLTGIRAFPSTRSAMLPSNVASYLARSGSYQDYLSLRLKGISGIENLYERHKSRAKRMLRLPILLPNRKVRDLGLKMLLRAGIGATALYSKPLIKIPGVADLAASAQGASGAEEFADRLLTLPVHSGMSEVHAQIICTLLRDIIG